MKRALIIGCAGQDGYYLSHRLHEMGYELYGMDMKQPDGCDFVKWKYGSIEKKVDVVMALKLSKPDEVYHLAAITKPGIGITDPTWMFNVNVIGTLNIFEAVHRVNEEIKVLYVSSDNVFGDNREKRQNELTVFKPTDLYGVTKATGLMLADVYRTYGLRIETIIPFNHSSQKQGNDFLLGRVAKEMVRVYSEIKRGGAIKPVKMKSRYDERDFLHAKDVVEAMVVIMEKGDNTDYVVGSGVPRTIEEIVNMAYRIAAEEMGLKIKPNIDVAVTYDKHHMDKMKPMADTRKIKALGWSPKIMFDELVKEIIKNEINK